jgi:hypothetical protein
MAPTPYEGRANDLHVRSDWAGSGSGLIHLSLPTGLRPLDRPRFGHPAGSAFKRSTKYFRLPLGLRAIAETYSKSSAAIGMRRSKVCWM